MTTDRRTPARTTRRLPAAKRSYSVPAAEKALDVLEFMASQPEGMTVTALAGALGRSVHELYRVILVLEARGYLYRRARLGPLPPVAETFRAGAPDAFGAAAHRLRPADHAGAVAEGAAIVPSRGAERARGADRPADRFAAADALLGDAGRKVRFRGDEFRRRHLRLFAAAAARPARRLAEGRQPVAATKSSTSPPAPRRSSRPAARCRSRWRSRASPTSRCRSSTHLGHVVAALTVPYMPQRAATVPLQKVRDLDDRGRPGDFGQSRRRHARAASRRRRPQEGVTMSLAKSNRPAIESLDALARRVESGYAHLGRRASFRAAADRAPHEASSRTASRTSTISPGPAACRSNCCSKRMRSKASTSVFRASTFLGWRHDSATSPRTGGCRSTTGRR